MYQSVEYPGQPGRRELARREVDRCSRAADEVSQGSVSAPNQWADGSRDFRRTGCDLDD